MQPAFLFTTSQVSKAAAVAINAVVVGTVPVPARSRLSALKPRQKERPTFEIYVCTLQPRYVYLFF